MASGLQSDLLEEPWRTRLRSVFTGLTCPKSCWDHVDIMAGTFNGCQGDVLSVRWASFSPGEGFDFSVDGIPGSLEIPGFEHRFSDLRHGDFFTCAGSLASSRPNAWVGKRDTVVMRRTEIDREEPWEFIHLFSGSFGGWAQAASTLSWLITDARVGPQLHVDADIEVVQILAHKFRSSPVQAPVLPRMIFDVRLNTPVHGLVRDLSILHVCVPHANLFLTASPPCTSWSRGGRAAGLNCEAGWSFVESIRFAFVSQAVLIGFECVDEITKHPHFPFLLKLLEMCGYQCISHAPTPLHLIAHCMRSRWLALFVRRDVTVRPACIAFEVATSRIEPWHSQMYNFPLPRSIRDQLDLSASEMVIYGDALLLPPVKRLVVGSNATPTQVLESRLASMSKPLPTLCASYGSQHLLNRTHLANKGIFATLFRSDAGFSYISPVLYAALLGAVEATTFSAKISIAFRQIGNAIAVPHALAVILSGLSITCFPEIDVHSLVLTAWDRRITSYSGVLFVDARFVTLARVSTVATQVQLEQPDFPEICQSLTMVCSPRASDISCSIQVPVSWTLNQVLQCFTWNNQPCQHLAFHIEGATINHLFDVQQSCTLSTVWQIMLHGHPVFDIRFEAQQSVSDFDATPDMPSKEPVAISPTMPFEVEAGDHPAEWTFSLHEIDFDDPTPDFRFLLQLLERAAGNVQQASGHVHLTFGSQNLSAAVPCSSHDLAIQSLIRSVVEHLRSQCDFDFHVWMRPTSVILGCHTIVVVGLLPPGQVIVLVRLSPDGFPCGAFFPHQCMPSSIFRVHSMELCIHSINGALDLPPSIALSNGDSVLLQPAQVQPIYAGGHHGSTPCTLPANATLLQRAEFASNSGGWLASDELNFLVSRIATACPEYAAFLPFAVWDFHTASLADHSSELLFMNNTLAILPVMSSAHWCAIEVLRDGHRVHATFVGFPRPLVDRAVHSLARIMDLTPQMIETSVVTFDDSDHFCGWRLIQRWILAAGLIDVIPPLRDNWDQLAISTRQLLEDVLTDSVEEWISSGIPHEQWFLAMKLRRYFFADLATNALPHTNLTSPVMSVHFTDVAPLPHQQTPPFQMIHPDVPDAYLLQRLRHFASFPGWLGSDELDVLLDFLRAHDPSHCYMPPARYNPDRNTLDFFNDKHCDFRNFTTTTWLALHNGCWFQIDGHMYTPGRWVFFYSAPPGLGNIPYLITAHLMCLLGAHGISAQTVIIPSRPDPTLCGWTLIYALFERAGVAVPPLAHAVQLTLNASRHRVVLFNSLNQAQATWARSTNHHHLVDFASTCRVNFLFRLLQGPGPAFYDAGGGEHDQPSQPAQASTAPGPPSKKEDPWKHYDPWMKSDPKPKQQRRLFSTKWEDLTLPKDHPIQDKKDASIPQIHRLQAAAVKHPHHKTNAAGIRQDPSDSDFCSGPPGQRQKSFC